jgi:hypothetical protein
MKIAMNQPYIFPYRGYFDLIASVDKFVIYDDAQYIKGGFINKNYFPERFTFRLKKHSSFAKINECYFLDIEEDKKIFPIKGKYLDLLTQEDNISVNIERTIKEICKDLGIKTEFYRASDIKHSKSTQGVIDIVRALGGDTYVNLPGGKKLYTQEMFGDIKLEFIETKPGKSILCEL